MATQSTLKGKKLAELYFTPESAGSNTWICKCGTKRLKNGSGYTNLVSHITSAHPEHAVVVQQPHAAAAVGPTSLVTTTTIKDGFYSKKTQNIHSWLKIIVMSLLPFAFCRSESVREFLQNGELLCVNSLKKHMEQLASIVEKKISDMLPAKFALVLDGWSAGCDTHYVAVFATFPDTSERTGYQKVLLSVFTIGDDETLDAKEHLDSLTFVLELYGKSWKNVVAIIGNDGPTNKALASRTGRRFIGCASHRFNLAVKDYMVDYMNQVTMISKLMKKLNNIIPATKLQKLTPLKPTSCSNNVTGCCWSCTHEMLSRYIELKEFLPRLGLPKIKNMMPTAPVDREIITLVEELKEFHEITESLQQSDAAATTMAEVRAIFDEAIESYYPLIQRLGARADIVQDKAFESAIVKIQNGHAITLTAEEARSVDHLKAPDNKKTFNDADDDNDQELSLVERARKKRRMELDGTTLTKFINLQFLLPTSNICEHLFVKAGYSLNDYRHGILPSDLELQLFLNANCNLWSIKDVDVMLKKQQE